MDRLLVCDLDGTLLGTPDATHELLRLLRRPRAPTLAFATGRQLYSAEAVLTEAGVADGTYLIAGVGTEIYRRIGGWTPLGAWPRLEAPWDDERVRRALGSVTGIEPQRLANATPYKLSYVAPASSVEAVETALARAGVAATVVHSHGELLDVLPRGIDKGTAVAWLAGRLQVGLDRLMTCGNTMNDLAMLRLACRSVVVGGSEVALLAAAPSLPSTYVAESVHASGIIEGLRYFGWLDGSDWT